MEVATGGQRNVEDPSTVPGRAGAVAEKDGCAAIVIIENSGVEVAVVEAVVKPVLEPKVTTVPPRRTTNTGTPKVDPPTC